MTTVSLVECISPVSLRSCGSSVHTLLMNRRRLQRKSPKKRSSSCKHSNQGLRDIGLEGSLLSSPIASPKPHNAAFVNGGRIIGHIATKSSSSLDEFCDDELDEEILRIQSCNSPDLLVGGSKPRFHGMCMIPDSQSETPSTERPAVVQNTEDIFDLVEDGDREPCALPENPTPSPINSRSADDGFMIGGQNLICPERCQSSHTSYHRDFNPGFFKQPLHNCVKCEDRVIEEELSQVITRRRINSILSRHASKHNYNEETLRYCSAQCKPIQVRMPNQSGTQSFSFSSTNAHEKTFYEIYTAKKCLKEEKGRQMKDQRKKRKAEQRTYEVAKLNQNLNGKEEGSQKISRSSSMVPYEAMKQMSSVADKDFDTKDSPQASMEDLTNQERLPSTTDRISQAVVVAEEASEDAGSHVRRVGSDAWLFVNLIPAEPKKTRTDTDEEEIKKVFSIQNRVPVECLLPSYVSPWKQHNDTYNTMNMDLKSSTTFTALRNGLVPTLTESNLELQQNQVNTTDETFSPADASKHSATTSSTLIIPDRDIPCTQWVSFNGDNEPVLNTSPDVNDACDTFLKRLQGAKLENQSDPALPSGQQFFFEPIVDKRYNRWKRRRRKKQSEVRRVNAVQSSESSDENDERNQAMESIIDRMYAEIHGPVPLTPNGSRDTPRSRNRRRRKDANSLPRTPVDDVNEQDSSVTLYDASSEWTSNGCLQSSSSSALQKARKLTEEAFIIDPEETGPNETAQPSQSSSVSDDLCSSSYLEQYNSEILKRLKDTPPDQLEDHEQNDWLPDIEDLHSGSIGHGNHDNDNHDICSTVHNNTGNSKLKIANSYQENAEIHEKMIIIDAKESDTDSGKEEYEPYIRVIETPRQSPTPVSIGIEERSSKNVQAKTKCDFESSRRIYIKKLRSQRSVASQLCSVEQKQKQKLLSRTNATSWREMSCEPDFRESNDSISVTDKLGTVRSAKKNQKVALNIKKQNVNLPSLTKNSKSQTMPESSAKQCPEKTDKPAKVKPRQKKLFDEIPQTESTSKETPNKSPLKHSKTVPDFEFKDYYQRSVNGYKTRMNSHVDSKQEKGLRKTLTVDNLELLAKKTKKESKIAKPDDLAFTRSFTFSMFDLPAVHKLYNTTLESRASGEEIETL